MAFLFATALCQMALITGFEAEEGGETPAECGLLECIHPIKYKTSYLWEPCVFKCIFFRNLQKTFSIYSVYDNYHPPGFDIRYFLTLFKQINKNILRYLRCSLTLAASWFSAYPVCKPEHPHSAGRLGTFVSWLYTDLCVQKTLRGWSFSKAHISSSLLFRV